MQYLHTFCVINKKKCYSRSFIETNYFQLATVIQGRKCYFIYYLLYYYYLFTFPFLNRMDRVHKCLDGQSLRYNGASGKFWVSVEQSGPAHTAFYFVLIQY